MNKVECGDFTPFAQSFFSRSVSKRFLYPKPGSNPKGFVDQVFRIDQERRYDAIVLISYDACVSFVEFAPNYTKTMLPDKETMRIAANKDLTRLMASKLNVPIPTTETVNSASDVFSAAEKLGYPFILKDVLGSGNNELIRKPEDISSSGTRLLEESKAGLIAQEFVFGEGFGFFALMNHGSCRAYFMHRRIRESTPYGGPSTCAESWFDEELLSSGLRMLEGLKWHGVAMAEFRRDRKSDVYKLLEINPKFWGSLDLSIASGVNFPQLLVDCITKGDCKESFNYVRGTKFQWPFPDDFVRLKWGAEALKPVVKDFIDPRVKKNVKVNDFAPTLISVGRLGKYLAKNGR